jgi:ATP-dependent DNA helicase RecQ
MWFGKKKPVRLPEVQTAVRGQTEEFPVQLYTYGLFERLRQLRLEVARKESIPPYIVFSDKTLIDMAVKAPADRNGMLEVSGVGAVKYDKYGEIFLREIADFRKEHPDAVVSIED